MRPHPFSSTSPWRGPLQRALAILPALFLLAALPTARAVTQVWEGLGADGNWTTSGNFSPGGVVTPSDSLEFDGNNYLTTNYNDLSSGGVVSITFNAGAGAFELNGGGLGTFSGMTNLSSNLQTINLSQFVVFQTQTWDAGAGGLTINSPTLFNAFSNITLTITGVGDTTINSSISQMSFPGTSGSLTKTGTGTLTLTAANTYTGGTTVTGGLINFNALANFGSGNITLDGGGLQWASGNAADVSGQLNALGASGGVFDTNGNDVTLASVLSGDGALTKTGTGTLALTGENTYLGGTRVEAGALLVGDDSALGTGALTLADGTAFGVVSGAGVFMTNDVFIEGDVDIRAGSGFLELDGTVDLGAATRTLTLTEDFSEVCFMGEITGSDGLTLRAAPGAMVNVMMCGDDNNTYTGLTTVGSGVGLLLEKDPDTVAIAGDLLIEDGGIVGVTSIGPQTVSQIASTSNVTVNGTGELSFFAISLDPADPPQEQTIAGLYGDGIVSSVADLLNLTVLSGDFAGSLGTDCGCGDALALIKNGPGVLRLSGSSSYTGGTTINAGTLRTDNVSALGSGPVTLTGGTFEPVSALTIDSLDWTGGAIARTLDTPAELLTILNDLTVSGGGGVFDFTAGAGFLPNLTFDLLSAANLDISMLGLFTGNTLFGLTPIFSLDGTTLEVTFAGTPVVSGPLLQNTGPVGIPVFADFIVNGPVTTGTPSESNAINSLIFNPGSSLQIFNNLTVTSGNFTVPTGSATMTGGNVIVPGTFTKSGVGLLNIFSNVFVNGPANVAGGSLLVNGTFTAGGGLTVFQNALLGGSGLINGNVFNNGIVSPGNSPGTLTVNGDFTQSSSGSLQIEVASPTVFDQLVVSGNASLAGTLQVLNYGGNQLAYGQQVPFLRAGSISGEFDQIQMPNPAIFRGRFLVNGGNGTLLVAPTSYTLVAQTTNQQNVAKALDSFIPATSGDPLAVSTALDLQTAEQYPAAFDQIAPTFYESLANTTIEQTNAQNQMLAQRLSAARLGARGFQAIGIEAPLTHDKSGKSVLDAKGGKDILTPGPDNKWGVWAQGNGIFAKVTNVSQVPNYRFESGGFLAGADYQWNEGFVTGVFAGYQGLYSKYNGGGSNTINSAIFGGYATYQKGGFYSDAIVSGGYSNYNVRRPVTFSTVDRTAVSQPDGGQFNTYLDFGYDWTVGGFTLGPIVSGQYTYAGIAPFTESGADSLNLRVNQQNANSLRTSLGGRIAYTWKVSEKIAIIPEVRMFWQHEFLNNPRNIGAALDGGSGPVFGYETSAPARDSVFAGAGVSAQLGDRWSAYFYYNADFCRQDFVSNMISGGLGWKF